MRRPVISLRNRRGVTLILTAFMATVLVGAGALAVDMGRMYLYRAQLQTAADGAALAAGQRLEAGFYTQSVDSAIAYAAKDSVAGTAVVLATANVIPGTWAPGTGFTPTAGADWSTANADSVKV